MPASPDDIKERDRLLAIGSERLRSARPPAAGTPLLAFFVSGSGMPILESPAGLSQPEAEALLVRAVLRYLLES